MTFRVRLAILFGLVLLVFGWGSDHVARDELRGALGIKLDRRGISIARDLAAMASDALTTGDEFGLTKILARTRINNPDTRYLLVVDWKGRVVASTFGALIPRGLLDVNDAPPGAAPRLIKIQTEEGLIRDIAVAIPDHLGAVRVGLTDQGLTEALDSYSASMSMTLVAILVAGLLASFGLAGFLTRPLTDLTAAVRSVGQGNFSGIIPEAGGGEVGQLAAEFNAMTRSLAEKEAMRQALLTKVITGQEEERRRVARDLHDDLAQVLIYVLLRLEELETRLAGMDADSRSALTRARQALEGSLAETRRLIADLRPTVLDDLGLVAALRSFAESRLQPVGCRVDFRAEDLNGCVDAVTETAVFRIVQEAINNVARHSGATRARIALRSDGTSVHGEVADDGCGYLSNIRAGKASELSGLGLQGMMERASLLGGSLHVREPHQGGTQVNFVVPCGTGRERDERGTHPSTVG